MTAMTADMHMSKWRNFASWSAAGGLVAIVSMAAASWLVRGAHPQTPFGSGVDPRLVLAVLFAMAVVGVSSRNRAFGWRSFRNFVILSVITCVVAIGAIMGLRALSGTGALGAMGVSQWVAAGTGVALLLFGILAGVMPGLARRGWTNLDAGQVELLRERSRMTLLSGIAMGAMGLMLGLLSLSGPGSAVTPVAGLAGLLVLLTITVLLSIVLWQQMDELDRTLSRETGNWSFYLILLFGGGWAILAHLGFVAAATPLDWLTMLTVILFAASFIAAGRRKLLGG